MIELQFKGVPCSIIYNSQDMEATQISIDGRMDKKDVVHIYIMEHYSVIKRNEFESVVVR